MDGAALSIFDGACVTLTCAQQALARAESRSIVAEGKTEARSIALQATVTLPGRSNLQARPSNAICAWHPPLCHHATTQLLLPQRILSACRHLHHHEQRSCWSHANLPQHAHAIMISNSQITGETPRWCNCKQKHFVSLRLHSTVRRRAARAARRPRLAMPGSSAGALTDVTMAASSNQMYFLTRYHLRSAFFCLLHVMYCSGHPLWLPLSKQAVSAR